MRILSLSNGTVISIYNYALKELLTDLWQYLVEEPTSFEYAEEVGSV